MTAVAEADEDEEYAARIVNAIAVAAPKRAGGQNGLVSFLAIPMKWNASHYSGGTHPGGRRP